MSLPRFLQKRAQVRDRVPESTRCRDRRGQEMR
jgi:hypothetical protein